LSAWWISCSGSQRELRRLERTMIEHEARFTRLFSQEELAQLFGYLRRIHP
jgi:hypothetical protein